MLIAVRTAESVQENVCLGLKRFGHLQYKTELFDRVGLTT